MNGIIFFSLLFTVVESPAANSVDADLKSITDEVYAEILKRTRFDPEKRKQLIQDGLEDPQAFARSLSPDQLARINKIANRNRSKK